MKSLICPNCGCIAHISDHLDQLKNHAICEMCGSSPYLHDAEIDPFTFPGQKDRVDSDEKNDILSPERR